MDLRWEEAGATMKSAIFARMNYDTIFEGEIVGHRIVEKENEK